MKISINTRTNFRGNETRYISGYNKNTKVKNKTYLLKKQCKNIFKTNPSSYMNFDINQLNFLLSFSFIGVSLTVNYFFSFSRNDFNN